MRRLSIGLALTALLLTTSSAAAITDGGPDGDAHPAVGALIAGKAYSDGTWAYCSGTLVAPTVFVTAAHCGDEGDRVRVSFDSAFTEGDQVWDGTFHADPAYPGTTPRMHDLAVVVLDAPVESITPAALPAADSLSNLPASQAFTSVGYGAYEVTSGPGGHHFLYDDVRRVAVGHLNATNKTLLRISMNPARGDGGTCYGDSGGPNFLGGTDIVAAITITGDAICRATNVDYRLDTPLARSFLGQYLSLP